MKFKEIIKQLFASQKGRQVESEGLQTLEELTFERFIRDLLTYEANCITVVHAAGKSVYLYRHRGSYRDQLYEFTESHWKMVSDVFKSKATEMSESLRRCVYEGYPFGKISLMFQRVSDVETNLYLHIVH